MDIIEAIHSEKLFKPCFKGGLESWTAWITLLRALSGLSMDDTDLDLYQRCTGRKTAPDKPVKELWAIVGRRGGKSFVSAIIAVFLALFHDYSKHLGPGERGTIQIIAADRSQAQVILSYIKGILHSTPVFEQYIETELKETVDLTNNITIEVMSCSFRSIRGRTVVCAIFDEMAFWRVEGASPDKEILSAIRPAMGTIPNSLLICISSPYARSGSVYEHHSDYYGKDDPYILVWQAPTRVMNPTLPQDIIDRETKKDPTAARAEWEAEFRDDISGFLNPEIVRACSVFTGDLAPEPGVFYRAFTDPSGGRADAFTLAIGYQDHQTRKFRTALLKGWKPPFDPETVVNEISEVLGRYRVSSVTGDRYAAAWVSSAFEKCGIEYISSTKNKSEIFLQSEGYFNTHRVEIPDDEQLYTELTNLERRTGRSGRDSVDHPPRGNDDYANAVCGLISLLSGLEDSFFANCDLT